MIMTAALHIVRKLVSKCHVCQSKLKIHEGKLCSCSLLLCMKHRYKDDHSCVEEKNITPMEKVQACKVEQI